VELGRLEVCLVALGAEGCELAATAGAGAGATWLEEATLTLPDPVKPGLSVTAGCVFAGVGGADTPARCGTLPGAARRCGKVTWPDGSISRGASPLATESGSEAMPIRWLAIWLADHARAAVATMPSRAAPAHVKL
jgi:hypothetical protein